MRTDEKAIFNSNPFWLSELVGYFNQGYGGDAPFELVYLIPPLLLRKESRRRVGSLNTKSTIDSAFLDSKNKQAQISGLPRQVNYYKHLIVPSLIEYSNKGNRFGITLKNGKNYNYSAVKSKSVREYCKAAHNLGVIFSKEDARECLYKLGVIKI